MIYVDVIDGDIFVFVVYMVFVVDGFWVIFNNVGRG